MSKIDEQCNDDGLKFRIMISSLTLPSKLVHAVGECHTASECTKRVIEGAVGGGSINAKDAESDMRTAAAATILVRRHLAASNPTVGRVCFLSLLSFPHPF